MGVSANAVLGNACLLVLIFGLVRAPTARRRLIPTPRERASVPRPRPRLNRSIVPSLRRRAHNATPRPDRALLILSLLDDLPRSISVRQAAQVDFAEFKRRFNRPTGIVIGLACQFVLLPLAGFASARVFFSLGGVSGASMMDPTAEASGAGVGCHTRVTIGPPLGA